jgi:hypothetical protein
VSEDQPARAGAPAAPRILRGWGAALVILMLLGWCAASQPFYRPFTAVATVVVLAVAIRWSWLTSARRGDRRRSRTRRRGDRRGD